MQGQCFCGAIRYQLKTPPQSAYYCHCRDCQYLAGGPFHVLAIVERGAIDLQSGKPGVYRHPTQDGSQMSREFCQSCGTPLFFTSSRWDDSQMITLSSLDDPDVLSPSFEIWTRSKRSWAHIEPGITSFAYGALDGNEEPGR